MDQQKQIDLLREALSGVLLALSEVYQYTQMDAYTLKKVQEAMNEAESTLQLTD